MRPPALAMHELVGLVQDFAGFLPATRDSLPPLDPASLIPVSPKEREEKESNNLARPLTASTGAVESCKDR